MLLPSHHRSMRLAGVRQWSDFVCFFGLKLLGAQKNRLTAVNNLGPPSAHAFHWLLWWMDRRTDRQTDRHVTN